MIPNWRLNRHFTQRGGRERVTWRLFVGSTVIARCGKSYASAAECERDIRRTARILGIVVKRSN